MAASPPPAPRPPGSPPPYRPASPPYGAPPSAYGNPAYGAPPAAAYGPPPNEPQATTAMVLGILGLAVCGIIAPIAWAIGSKSLANIRASGGRLGGEGMAKAGYIMGIIGTILLGLAIIWVIFWFAVIGAAVGGAAGAR